MPHDLNVQLMGAHSELCSSLDPSTLSELVQMVCEFITLLLGDRPEPVSYHRTQHQTYLAAPWHPWAHPFLPCLHLPLLIEPVHPGSDWQSLYALNHVSISLVNDMIMAGNASP